MSARSQNERRPRIESESKRDFFAATACVKVVVASSVMPLSSGVGVPG